MHINHSKIEDSSFVMVLYKGLWITSYSIFHIAGTISLHSNTTLDAAAQLKKKQKKQKIDKK